MPTQAERAVLDQLAEQAAPYLALERFVLGEDRALALTVLRELAAAGLVAVTLAGAPVPQSRIEDWAAAPHADQTASEIGVVEVDITAAGLSASID